MFSSREAGDDRHDREIPLQSLAQEPLSQRVFSLPFLPDAVGFTVNPIYTTLVFLLYCRAENLCAMRISDILLY